MTKKNSGPNSEMKGISSSLRYLKKWIEEGESAGFEIPQKVKRSLGYIEEHSNGLHEYATTDDLTGVQTLRASRELVETTLAKEEEKRRKENRRKISSYCFILYDLDDFKTFNDKYGKPVGNFVLRRFGRILRKTDIPYGGRLSEGADEFFLFLSNTDEDGAVVTDARVRDYLEKSKETAARALERKGADKDLIEDIRKISFSGCIVVHDRYLSFNRLFKEADSGLNEVKEDGKGFTGVYRLSKKIYS